MYLLFMYLNWKTVYWAFLLPFLVYCWSLLRGSSDVTVYSFPLPFAYLHFGGDAVLLLPVGEVRCGEAQAVSVLSKYSIV